MSDQPLAGRHVARDDAARSEKPFLRTIRMDAFGAFSGKVVGPFARG